MTTYVGPLAGLRVIDFGQYVAGPAVAMIFADLGAEVVRIDPPGGPLWDSPATAALNRGKKSITLDLKNDADNQTALALIRTADVLVENFRPGVMKRLGLGAEALRNIHPQLVYLSLPGFSAADQLRAGLPGWEGLVLSATGGYTDMGLNRVLMGINPSYSPLPLASSYAAALGALGVLVALLDRETTGLGEAVEVPLADAVLEGLAYNSLRVDDLPRRYLSLREQEIDRRRAEGQPMDMSYDELQELLDPFYRSFRCADGRLFYHCCPAHRTHAIAALRTLGLWDDVAEQIPTFDPYLDREDWPADADCTLLAYPLSQDWTHRLAEPIKQAFAQRTSQEWEARFDAARIPGAIHRSSAEWMHSDHARTAALMIEVADPRYGRLLRPGPVIWTDDSPLNTASAPTPDADRHDLLKTLTQSAQAAAAPNNSAATKHLPLDHVRILDITNVIAGPTIGSTLARFGATVTKIDPVIPTFDPYHNIVVGLQANRGKRSVLLDLSTAAGQKLLEKLIADHDVVTFNGTTSQMNALGLAPERLHAINPDIAIVRIDAYGGQLPGPRSEVVGYDDNVQACTGIMTRFGGSPDTPEEHAHLGTIDALAGFLASAATVAVILQQRRTGRSATARVSLAAAGQFLQTPFMYDHPGREPFNEPRGRHTVGEDACYRSYRAADGPLFFAGRHRDLAALSSFDDFAELPLDGDDTAVANFLTAVFQRYDTSYWSAILAATPFGVHRVEAIADLKERNTTRESEGSVQLGTSTMLFLRHDQHPVGRWVDLPAPNAIRLHRLAVQVPGPAPRFGEHTYEVLAQLGCSDHDIATLQQAGIVADRWTPNATYLPA